MTTTVSHDHVTGDRIVRVSRSTVAAAQARQSIASKLGLPVSKAVQKIASLSVEPTGQAS